MCFDGRCDSVFTLIFCTTLVENRLLCSDYVVHCLCSNLSAMEWSTNVLSYFQIWVFKSYAQSGKQIIQRFEIPTALYLFQYGTSMSIVFLFYQMSAGIYQFNPLFNVLYVENNVISGQLTSSRANPNDLSFKSIKNN